MRNFEPMNGDAMKLAQLVKLNFERLLISKDMTQADVAERYPGKKGKVEPNYISQLFTAEKLTLRTISRLAEVFEVEESDLVKEPDQQSQFENQYAMVPLVDVYAEGGDAGYYGEGFREMVDQYPFKLEWLQSKGYSGARAADLHLIRVRGESMTPTINDGEIVMVDRGIAARLPENIKAGQICIIRWGINYSGLSVKRVHLDWDMRELIATSDNELYLPKRIPIPEGEELQKYVLGKVVWVGKENI